MKKTLIALAAVLATLSGFAQGTIRFDNRSITAGDIRVYHDQTRTSGPGTIGTVNAQLFHVTGSGAFATYTPLVATTTFQTSPEDATYFVNPVTVVTHLPAGTVLNLVMRAWNGPTWEVASTLGWNAQSAPFSLRLGGVDPATGEIIPTPDLGSNLGDPMKPFYMIIPEPSTVALSLLGAVALLYRRLKSAYSCVHCQSQIILRRTTMKKSLIALVAVLGTMSAFAQGTILFDNRTLTAGDIRVYGDETRTRGAGTRGTLGGGTVYGQLFIVTGSGATRTYSPLLPVTTFRTSPAEATYFVNPVTVTTDLPAGTTVNLVMRAWPSFEPFLGGTSDVFSLRLGGANPVTGEIIPTPDLGGNLGNPMAPFHMFVPEPSTIALGVLGSAALLYRRRT